MKRISRRIFTAEFKREAIQQVTQQGLPMAEASRKRELGLGGRHHFDPWATREPSFSEDCH